MLTVSQTQTGRKCATVKFSGSDSCWHADQATSGRCYVSSTCTGFLPVHAGVASAHMGEGTGSVGGWGGCMDFYPSYIQTNAIILIFKNVLSPAEVYARLVLLKSVKISKNLQCLHDIFRCSESPRRCSTNWHVWHWKRTDRTVPQSLW